MASGCFCISMSITCMGIRAEGVSIHQKLVGTGGNTSILSSSQEDLEIKNMYSGQDTLPTVGVQNFEVEDFFDIKDVSFRKDKVNFNKGWLGIFMEDAGGTGILVKEITKGSPAAEAGIRAGDIITKINNESTVGKDNHNLIQFKRTIEAIGAGGEPVLTVSRDGAEMVFSPRLFGKLLKNRKELIPSFISDLREEAEISPHANRTRISFMDFVTRNGEYKNALAMTLQRIGEESFAREGFQSHNGINPFRLSLINYLMLHPFDSYKIGQTIHDKFLSEDYRAQMKFITELLDLKANFFSTGPEATPVSSPSQETKSGNYCSPSTPQEGERDVAAKPQKILLDGEQRQKAGMTAPSLQEKLQHVIHGLVPCVSLVKEAFSNLSQEETEFLYQHVHKIWLPDERIEHQSLSRLLALSQKADLARLLEAASLLLYNLSPLCFPMNEFTCSSEQWLDAIKKTQQDTDRANILPFLLPEPLRGANPRNDSGVDSRSKRKRSKTVEKDYRGFAGDILFVQDTSIGKIVVGGTGTSYYYTDAAVIFDLGGNDYYFNNAGSSSKDIPVSICIDFSGDDVYNAAGPFTQGTGRFGIGLLVDLIGDDKYLGKEYAQGSCLFGIGILSDHEGDDTYSGNVLNQGTGFFGAGLLHDFKGNDAYFSRQFAQGVGFTKGVGVLIDVDGNDSYTAGGKYPDFRDPEKSFQSMSQGIGMGIRPEETVVGASGGIGILIDQKGSDRYYGDYFSQGSGYYYSLGFLYDKEGSDRYYAGRYAQGAGIHSAIGLLTDTSGDDVYECSFGVSQGCGHDTGVGFLVDSFGNDIYRSRTSSQGIGLEKGMGILADFCGDDAYYANDTSQGVSSPSKTEEIIGIGILADNQGDHDVFSDSVKEKLLFYRVNGGVILNR